MPRAHQSEADRMTARIRLTYTRSEPFRYTGHLDFQRAWERTLRRSRLPVAYSQGFNPQVRLHLACALPLGLTSQYELVDFWLEDAVPPEDIRTALEKAFPPGIELLQVEEVDLKAPALQNQVAASDYEITLLDAIPQPDLEERESRPCCLPRSCCGNGVIRHTTCGL